MVDINSIYEGAIGLPDENDYVPPPRKMPFWKKFLIFIFILAVIVVLGLGYLGFMPGVSKYFGSDKARNLGITASAADEKSISEKLGIEYIVLPARLPADSSLVVAGGKEVKAQFTDAELTALMAMHEKMWKYYPVSDAQVKFNQDGTVEVSGILRTDRIEGYAAATGIAGADLMAVLDKLRILAPNPPFYIKGRADINGGMIAGELQKLEIGRLPVPISWVSGSQEQILSFAKNRLDYAGIKVSEGNFESGKVNFSGTLPTSIGFSKE